MKTFEQAMKDYTHKSIHEIPQLLQDSADRKAEWIDNAQFQKLIEAAMFVLVKCITEHTCCKDHLYTSLKATVMTIFESGYEVGKEVYEYNLEELYKKE